MENKINETEKMNPFAYIPKGKSETTDMAMVVIKSHKHQLIFIGFG